MYFDNHLDVLRAAVEANRTRVAWTGYSPITPPDAAAADEIVASYDGVTLELCPDSQRDLRARGVAVHRQGAQRELRCAVQSRSAHGCAIGGAGTARRASERA